MGRIRAVAKLSCRLLRQDNFATAQWVAFMHLEKLTLTPVGPIMHLNELLRPSVGASAERSGERFQPFPDPVVNIYYRPLADRTRLIKLSTYYVSIVAEYNNLRFGSYQLNRLVAIK